MVFFFGLVRVQVKKFEFALPSFSGYSMLLTRSVTAKKRLTNDHFRGGGEGDRLGGVILFLSSLNYSVPRDAVAVYSEHELHWESSHLCPLLRRCSIYMRTASDPKRDFVHVIRFCPTVVLV